MARAVFTDIPPSENAEDGATEPRVRRKPIIKGGATSSKYIAAATQGGSDRTYQEIFVDQIQDSRIKDRIDINEDIESLVESIRSNGQQIPIHVRVVQGDKPYEIVVGRRRLNAIRSLGQTKIKAFVSKLDEREAFIAQGVENSARLETSYIERARAAGQGIAAGFQQTDVSQFLNISKTMISFMVRTYETLGEDLVTRIGPARTIGRRKWDDLIKAMQKRSLSPAETAKLVDPEIADSAERFEALLKVVQNPQSGGPTDQQVLSKVRKPSAVPQRRRLLNGAVKTLRKSNQLTIKTDETIPDEFLEKLYEKLEELTFKLANERKG